MMKAPGRKLGLWATVIAGAMGLVGPAWAASHSDAEVEATVKELLMDRHPKDTADWWRELGASAPGVIMKVYATDSNTYHQMRLLEGLSAFTDDAAAVDFVKRQVESTSQSVVRNAGLRALGSAQGAREEGYLAGYLKHEDPHTRLTAAQALGKMNSAGARARVVQFMANEKTPWIVAKLKGEALPIGAVVAAASSEDRLSRDFEGVWSGFWVTLVGAEGEGARAQAQGAGKTVDKNSPDKVLVTGPLMRSEPVTMELKSDGATALGGTFTVKAVDGVSPVDVDVRYRLSRVQGKTLRWNGRWVKEAPRMMTPGRPLEFVAEADLTPVVGGFTLVVRSAGDGAVLVLRREKR